MLLDEWRFEDMNIISRLMFVTCQLDMSAMVHTEQAAHTCDDRHIAFLFELDDLQTKLQRMLALEWHSALGRLRHGDSMN